MPRHILTPEERARGGRKRISATEDTVRYSIRLPQSLKNRADTAGTDKVRQVLDEGLGTPMKPKRYLVRVYARHAVHELEVTAVNEGQAKCAARQELKTHFRWGRQASTIPLSVEEV